MADLQLIYTTWPDTGTAQAAARQLLEKRLIACANIMPAGLSLYRWEDDICSEAETVMILKTSGDACRAARDFIAAVHPYDTPCILVLDTAAVNTDFGTWAVAQTTD